LIFAGSTYAGDFSQLLFSRLNPNGTIDNSFGTNGYTEINASIQDEQINAVKLMTNGTIIGVGYGYQGSPMWSDQAIMAKLTSSGAPAPGFGTNGVLIPSVFSDVSTAFDLVIDNDSIFITGYLYNASNNWQLCLTKLNPSGNPYTDFGTNGISLLYLNPLNVGYEMLRTVDGKIYISGTTGQGGTGDRDFLLVRYLPFGDLDEDFDANSTSVCEGAAVQYTDVRLIVYDGIYIDTLLKENYISVESVPYQPDMPTVMTGK
jgi:uncharacterized delta-60 repeat protein